MKEAFVIGVFALCLLAQYEMNKQETADHAQQIAALERQINRLQVDLRQTESALMAKDLICKKDAGK